MPPVSKHLQTGGGVSFDLLAGRPQPSRDTPVSRPGEESVSTYSLASPSIPEYPYPGRPPISSIHAPRLLTFVMPVPRMVYRPPAMGELVERCCPALDLSIALLERIPRRRNPQSAAH